MKREREKERERERERDVLSTYLQRRDKLHFSRARVSPKFFVERPRPKPTLQTRALFSRGYKTKTNERQTRFEARETDRDGDANFYAKGVFPNDDVTNFERRERMREKSSQSSERRRFVGPPGEETGEETDVEQRGGGTRGRGVRGKRRASHVSVRENRRPR